MAVRASEPVVIVPYDPEWPRTFESLREVFLRALGDLAVAVEHVDRAMICEMLFGCWQYSGTVIRATSEFPGARRSRAKAMMSLEMEVGAAGRRTTCPYALRTPRNSVSTWCFVTGSIATPQR
jgi:hypothetical protein